MNKEMPELSQLPIGDEKFIQQRKGIVLKTCIAMFSALKSLEIDPDQKADLERKVLDHLEAVRKDCYCDGIEDTINLLWNEGEKNERAKEKPHEKDHGAAGLDG